MDENTRIRLEELRNTLITKEAKFEKDLEAFKGAFFTPTVRDMLSTIENHYMCEGKQGERYTYRLSQGSVVEIVYTTFYVNDRKLIGHNIKRDNFSSYEETIHGISENAIELRRNRETLQLLQDNAKDILSDIAETYENITLYQNGMLDEIASILEVNEKPIRQIKITVEYV